MEVSKADIGRVDKRGVGDEYDQNTWNLEGINENIYFKKNIH